MALLLAFHKIYIKEMMNPMTDYYIASSHNTYLKGDQIKGKCTVDAYRDAIEKGRVRFLGVEVNC